MALEFHEVDLSGMGAATSSGKEMVATVSISFVDTELKIISDIKARVFVPKNSELKFGQLQEAARSNTIALLRAALAELETHDLPTLERMGEERSDAHINLMLSKE